MFLRWSVAAAALAVGLAAPARAEEAARLTEGQPVVITYIEFQRLQQSRLPAQDVAAVCRMAQATGRPVTEIVALRQRGMTWSEICARYGMPTSLLQGPVMVVMPMERALLTAPQQRVAGERLELALPPATTPVAMLSPYPSFERKLPDRVWNRAYRLTPADYVRFRAGGLSRREVFLIANAARISGERPEDLAQMIYRGTSALDIALTLNVMPRRLDEIQPEWRTPEWAAAVGEREPIRGADLGFF